MIHTVYAATTTDSVSETAGELTKILEYVIAKIPLWILAMIVLVLTIVLGKIARRMVENKLAEKGIEEEHKELQILGGRMTSTTILVLGFTAALKVAGIDLTTIIAAGAFGIGFALKDLIMNFLAGVMILLGRHFTIGDFIKVGGSLGKVIEIQSRVTVLQAIDGTKIIVPNADIFKKQVVSYTSNPYRRIEVTIGIGYDGDIENAIKVCHHVLNNTRGVLKNPKPSVLVEEFADFEIPIKLRAWVDSKSGWLKIKSDLTINIKKELDKFNIVMPWPTYTIANEKEQRFEERKFEEALQEADTEKSTPYETVNPIEQTEIAMPNSAEIKPTGLETSPPVSIESPQAGVVMGTSPAPQTVSEQEIS